MDQDKRNEAVPVVNLCMVGVKVVQKRNTVVKIGVYAQVNPGFSKLCSSLHISDSPAGVFIC